eukprot:Lithocolla_globosa_v1_NODE_4738_length_1377_cov_8.562784.p2 type:complete len:186 gc:universal NODE_4738_length_1377_cov_8.562784:612-55(-)
MSSPRKGRRSMAVDRAADRKKRGFSNLRSNSQMSLHLGSRGKELEEEEVIQDLPYDGADPEALSKLVEVFAVESFNSSDYLKTLLKENSEVYVRHHHHTLEDAYKKSGALLQQNVHDNYHHFMRSSKEIFKLETEALHIRSALTDLWMVRQDLSDFTLEKSGEKKTGTPSDKELLSSEVRSIFTL